MWGKAFFLLALAGGGNAQEQRFDLVCTGTWAFSASDVPEPHTWHFRLDLADMKYCDGACVATRPIADVQPNLITIETEVNDYPRGVRIHHIDRTNGRYVDFDTIGGHWLDARADCSSAPFSGFPRLETKF